MKEANLVKLTALKDGRDLLLETVFTMFPEERLSSNHVIISTVEKCTLNLPSPHRTVNDVNEYWSAIKASTGKENTLSVIGLGWAGALHPSLLSACFSHSLWLRLKLSFLCWKSSTNILRNQFNAGKHFKMLTQWVKIPLISFFNYFTF